VPAAERSAEPTVEDQQHVAAPAQIGQLELGPAKVFQLELRRPCIDLDPGDTLSSLLDEYWTKTDRPVAP